MKINNPANGTIIEELSEDTAATLKQKFNRLKSAQVLWGQVEIQERIDMLMKFHDLLDDRKEKLAQDLTAETGKPLQQSYNELNGARNRVKWICANAKKYLADDWMVEEEGMGEKISYEPEKIYIDLVSGVPSKYIL
jgi:acyl-CoA reductase-like NAD-dependent aldehyde dehydrogenase